MECDSAPTTDLSHNSADLSPAPLCCEFCGDANCQCDGVNRPTIDGVMVSSIDSALCEFCGQHSSKCECDTVPLAMPVVGECEHEPLTSAGMPETPAENAAEPNNEGNRISISEANWSPRTPAEVDPSESIRLSDADWVSRETGEPAQDVGSPAESITLAGATWAPIEASAAEEEESAGSEGKFGAPLLSKKDLPGAFISDDMAERIAFMEILAERRLPMPQNEGQFHASRIYIDIEQCSRYSIEQWLDYLQLHGYTLKDLSSNAEFTDGAIKNVAPQTEGRSSPKVLSRFKALAEYAETFKGSVHFMRQTFRGEAPALVVVHRQMAWYNVRLVSMTTQGVLTAEHIKRCITESGAMEWAAEV